MNPQKSVDFMIENANAYAQAEANKTYLEEYRKTIKAEEMRSAELAGHKTAAMQEREAYSSPRYKAHLEALKEAVEQRERLRWLLIAAQERIGVWRSQNASNRTIEKMTL